MDAEKQTVLVVEDEPLIQMLVVDFLNDLGYSTLEASDARTALPLIESDRRIDLLITDVGLPGINGRELADIARRHRPGLRILFATGYAEGQNGPLETLAPGMELVVKPFDMTSLEAKVREMTAPN